MKYVYGCRVLFACLLLCVRAAEAQEATELAKQTQNPVADLTSIPFQFNFFSGGDLKDRTLSLVNIQPVIPLPVTEHWNVITRPVIPIVNTPLPDGDRELGLGDIQTQLFATPAEPGRLIWGVGPVLSFPTATNDSVRTGQWGLGPAGVLVLPVGRWVLGLLVDPVWRIAGSERQSDLDMLTIQPFVNLNFTQGWALSFQPLITAKWSAPTGGEWTVPLGLGIAKVHKIGAQALNLSLQYYRNVVYPDGAGANQVRFLIAFLFPNTPHSPAPAQAHSVQAADRWGRPASVGSSRRPRERNPGCGRRVGGGRAQLVSSRSRRHGERRGVSPARGHRRAGARAVPEPRRKPDSAIRDGGFEQHESGRPRQALRPPSSSIVKCKTSL